MSKNPKFVSKLLGRSKSVEGLPKWVVIVGDKSRYAGRLVEELTELNVHSVAAVDGHEATSVIMRHDVAPNLVYIFAHEVGGVDQAMHIHRYLARHSGFGRCVIVSDLADENDRPFDAAPASMLILDAGRAATMH